METTNWNNLSTEYLRSKKDFEAKYKDDYLSVAANSWRRPSVNGWFIDYKITIFVLFFGFTILHLIISLNFESISFFSKNWFTFYLVLSIIGPIIVFIYKENRYNKMDRKIIDLREKFNELKKIYFENENKLLSSSKFLNVEIIKKDIEVDKFNQERLNLVNSIQIGNILSKMDDNTASIRKAHSDLFNLK